MIILFILILCTFLGLHIKKDVYTCDRVPITKAIWAVLQRKPYDLHICLGPKSSGIQQPDVCRMEADRRVGAGDLEPDHPSVQQTQIYALL